MEQLTQDEASANEGNRHTTSQPTDCSIPSSSLPTSFPICCVRPQSVHRAIRGDHGADERTRLNHAGRGKGPSVCNKRVSPRGQHRRAHCREQRRWTLGGQ